MPLQLFSHPATIADMRECLYALQKCREERSIFIYFWIHTKVEPFLYLFFFLQKLQKLI